MEKIKTEELYTIVGGINITSAILNALTSAASTIFDVGKAFGSAIRRISTRSLCTFRW